MSSIVFRERNHGDCLLVELDPSSLVRTSAAQVTLKRAVCDSGGKQCIWFVRCRGWGNMTLVTPLLIGHTRMYFSQEANSLRYWVESPSFIISPSLLPQDLSLNAPIITKWVTALSQATGSSVFSVLEHQEAEAGQLPRRALRSPSSRSRAGVCCALPDNEHTCDDVDWKYSYQ